MINKEHLKTVRGYFNIVDITRDGKDVVLNMEDVAELIIKVNRDRLPGTCGECVHFEGDDDDEEAPCNEYSGVDGEVHDIVFKSRNGFCDEFTKRRLKHDRPKPRERNH